MANKEELTGRCAIAEKEVEDMKAADKNRRRQISKILGCWDPDERGGYAGNHEPLQWEGIYAHIGRLMAEARFGEWQMKVTHLEQLFHAAMKNHEDKSKGNQE